MALQHTFPTIIDLTNDSSDSDSTVSDIIDLTTPDSDSDLDIVYNSDDEDDDTPVSLLQRRPRPSFHPSTVVYYGFSPLTRLIDFWESPGPKLEASSFLESSYVPGHTARLFWVKSGPSRWVKMSAFVPDTECWLDFFHVNRDAHMFPKTLQYELIGLSTVLQMRGLSDLRFLFLNFLVSSNQFLHFSYAIDRTTHDKIEHNILALGTLMDNMNMGNPIPGYNEQLDRPYCFSCGEPNFHFLPGVKKANRDSDKPFDWRARQVNRVRHCFCDTCSMRKPVTIHSFWRYRSEPLEIVANLDPRTDKLVRRGTRLGKMLLQPELWLKSDYVCSITGVPRKIFPWDEQLTVHVNDAAGTILEYVKVYPQRWSLSPAHDMSETCEKIYVRAQFPTERNYELVESTVIVNKGRQVPIFSRRFRTSMNFLSVAPGGFKIHDTWLSRTWGVDSSASDYGVNLYAQMRYGEEPYGEDMHYYTLRRMVNDREMHRLDTYEITPPMRQFGQSALALRKANALYWLMYINSFFVKGM